VNIISHDSKINLLSESPLKDHIQARFDQLSEDTDIPPFILLLHCKDIPRSSELSFLGSLSHSLRRAQAEQVGSRT
jgi:hypothetical protein